MKTPPLIILTLVATATFAYPGPTPPVVTEQSALDFGEQVAKAGNFSIAISPGYFPQLGAGQWGLAIFGGYQISEYLGAYVRADLVDGNYTIASGSVTAQIPIHFGKITVRPFAEAGVGSTLGGSGDKNKEVFAIAGGGVFIDVWHSKDGRQSLSVGGAVETWQPTYQGVSIYRGFAGYTIHF